MSGRVTTGLRVVRLLGERPDPTAPLGVGALAAELGAPLSSVSRLCAELERTGLIERGADYGSYRLGAVAVRLSGRAAAPVARSIKVTVPDAGAPRSSTTIWRSWLLADRSPGPGGRPPQLLTTSVRSSSVSLGSKGSICTGYSWRIWRVAGSTSTTALRLAAATKRRVPSRVIAIPPGTGFPLTPRGWMVIGRVGFSRPPS